jgi:hypothetical protein
MSHGGTDCLARMSQPWRTSWVYGMIREPVRLLFKSRTSTVIDTSTGQHPWLQMSLVVYWWRSVVVSLGWRQRVEDLAFLELQLTSFLGRRVLSPGISYGRRKGSAGPCHALDPTGKGRLMVLPWVLGFRSVNLSGPRPDTLLGPIDS